MEVSGLHFFPCKTVNQNICLQSIDLKTLNCRSEHEPDCYYCLNLEYYELENAHKLLLKFLPYIVQSTEPGMLKCE